MPVAGSKVVTVSAPLGMVITVPTATVVPLIVTVIGASPPVKVIVPLVVSVGAGAFEPGASVPRAGRPDSATTVPGPELGIEVMTGAASAMAMVSVAVEAEPSASVRV